MVTLLRDPFILWYERYSFPREQPHVRMRARIREGGLYLSLRTRERSVSLISLSPFSLLGKEERGLGESKITREREMDLAHYVCAVPIRPEIEVLNLRNDGERPFIAAYERLGTWS